ncbi:MAG: GDSL-type esterase/lipase family protein [Ilumatobacteraceae bacterium]
MPGCALQPLCSSFGQEEEPGVSHQKSAANPTAIDRRSRIRPVATHSVVLASIVLAAVAPGLSPGGAVGAAADTSAFVAVGPHRLADTRAEPCGCERVDASTIRVVIAGREGIPGDITAAALTVTSTNVDADGFVTAYPAGTPAPQTSTANPRAGSDLANSAIVPVGDDGAVDVRSTLAIDTDIDLVIDVTGVFVRDDQARAGRFVPIEPTRISDSRTPGAPATGLAAGTPVDIHLPEGVDDDATAMAINVTTVGGLRAGFFSARPATQGSTETSFMNPDGSGRPRAASVIVPVSPDGFVVTTHAGGHLIVDVVGWFTGPSADNSDEGLFVATAPSRLVDSRSDAPRLWPNGTRELAIDFDAAAIATNVTVDRTDDSGFVTAYPAGTPLPTASTINAFGINDTIANFAITPVSDRGSAYYSDRGTDLIVDVTGYFTGSPMTATLPVPPNIEPPARTLLVGDSTLAGVRWYGTTEALLGYPYVLTAESCRRLATASCRGREGYTPTNAVNAIRNASGTFGAVVIMAGYDDWWTVFPSSFDQVVAAARAKGARTIVWLTYREGVGYVNPSGVSANEAFVRNNQTLREKVASGAFPDVVLADWHSYTENTSGWLAGDGIHLTLAGSYGAADYISRVLAHLQDRACPMPWVVGGQVDDPCPDPDTHAPVADIMSLYT